jgi:hypothetical protein
MPPAAFSPGAAPGNAPTPLLVNVPPVDLGLMATAFAPPGGSNTLPSAGTPPRNVAPASPKGTEMRTVDPNIGATLPAAAAAPPAPRSSSVLPFGNVVLTPIASVASVPAPPLPPPPPPPLPPLQPPPLPPPPPPPPPPAAPPPPPAQAQPRSAAIPTFDGLPPLPAKQRPSLFPPPAESPEPVVLSRAAPTLVGEAGKAPPPLSIARTPRPLGGFLVSFQYEPLGAFWPLALGDNRIGRAGARPDVDVAIADATISSEQAILTVERGSASIEDRGSTNHTFVNGRSLVAGTRAPLRHGDRVRLGSYETIMVLLPL